MAYSLPMRLALLVLLCSCGDDVQPAIDAPMSDAPPDAACTRSPAREQECLAWPGGQHHSYELCTHPGYSCQLSQPTGTDPLYCCKEI